MKVPPKRKGNSLVLLPCPSLLSPLNESPSEKEGKCVVAECAGDGVVPSMKVPPKRKGNLRTRGASPGGGLPSMKVPPKRKGNDNRVCIRCVPRPPQGKSLRKGREIPDAFRNAVDAIALNESPSEKEGKSFGAAWEAFDGDTLNESPSEKEGKSAPRRTYRQHVGPSMKVPPKRKGNAGNLLEPAVADCPQ